MKKKLDIFSVIKSVYLGQFFATTCRKKNDTKILLGVFVAA